jgi:ethanolaminephosphotransferase
VPFAQVDNSTLSAKLQPYWNFVASLLPRWLAPNAITAIGSAVVVAATALCVLTPEGSTRGRPAYVNVAVLLATFFFQTADAVDGKQARATGMPRGRSRATRVSVCSDVLFVRKL